MDMVTITRGQYESDIREAKVEALREAAQNWHGTFGDDTDLYSGDTALWLRRRADDIEAGR